MGREARCTEAGGDLQAMGSKRRRPRRPVPNFLPHVSLDKPGRRVAAAAAGRGQATRAAPGPGRAASEGEELTESLRQNGQGVKPHTPGQRGRNAPAPAPRSR
jgi:hypothetical protein